MSACPFKVGELVLTDSDTEARVVYIGDDDSRWPVLVIHPSKSSDGGEMSAWHTLSGEGRCGAPNLIPPAPPTVLVPLGPEDVPPGSVVSRHPSESWMSINALYPGGLSLDTFHDWESLKREGYQIKPPGGDWQPMWKEIPAGKGGE